MPAFKGNSHLSSVFGWRNLTVTRTIHYNETLVSSPTSKRRKRRILLFWGSVPGGALSLGLICWFFLRATCGSLVVIFSLRRDQVMLKYCWLSTSKTHLKWQKNHAYLVFPEVTFFIERADYLWKLELSPSIRFLTLGQGWALGVQNFYIMLSFVLAS